MMVQNDEKFDAIDAKLAAFEDAMTTDVPVDMGTFIQRRVTLARAVNEFMAGEQNYTSDIVLLNVPLASQEDQQELYRSFVKLRMTYSAHIATWDNVSLAARWPAYRKDCLELIAGMRGLLRIRKTVRLRAAR